METLPVVNDLATVIQTSLAPVVEFCLILSQFSISD